MGKNLENLKCDLKFYQKARLKEVLINNGGILGLTFIPFSIGGMAGGGASLAGASNLPALLTFFGGTAIALAIGTVKFAQDLKVGLYTDKITLLREEIKVRTNDGGMQKVKK